MRRQIISALFPFALVGLVLTGCSNPEVDKQKHFDRGNAFAEKKAFNEAILEYRSAIQLDERFGLAQYRLALAYEQAGDMNLALREMVRAADQLPDDAA